MGGINGLLPGPGIDRINGPSIGRKVPESGSTLVMVVTTPAIGGGGDAGEIFAHEGVTYTGTIEDRQRVHFCRPQGQATVGLPV